MLLPETLEMLPRNTRLFRLSSALKRWNSLPKRTRKFHHTEDKALITSQKNVESRSQLDNREDLAGIQNIESLCLVHHSRANFTTAAVDRSIRAFSFVRSGDLVPTRFLLVILFR